MIGPGIFSLSFAWAIKPELGVNLPGTPFALAGLLLLGAMRDCVAGDATLIHQPTRVGWWGGTVGDLICSDMREPWGGTAGRSGD